MSQDAAVPEADEQQQQGGQCGCVHLWLMFGFFAGALEGGILGFRLGERLYGWWGRTLGAAGGAVAGALAGVVVAMVVVAITGLVVCGLMWIEERGKRPREGS